MKISVIIPALNEETTIARTIRILRRVFPDEEIIVVDGNSNDRTFEKAILAGAHKVLKQQDSGKGNAIMQGLSQSHGKIVVFFDADIRNISQKMLSELIKPILLKKCDVAVGYYQSPYPQIFTEFVYRPLIRTFFPEVEQIIKKTPLSGERAMLRSTASKLVFLEGFGVETGMNIDLVMRSFKVKEIWLGKINPVFKGVLGKNIIRKRGSEIANAILLKAKHYNRLKRLGKAKHLKTVIESLLHSL